MTKSERAFKVERLAHIRSRLRNQTWDVNASSGHMNNELLREAMTLEEELRTSEITNKIFYTRLKLALIFSMIFAIIFCMTISLVTSTSTVSWILAAASIFFITYGVSNASSFFKRGQRWQGIAWVSVGLAIFGLGLSLVAIHRVISGN